MKRQLIINLDNKQISTNYVYIEDIISNECDDLNFHASILSGYRIIGVNRIEVFSEGKSSKTGGFFSHHLKCNNYDIITIKGKSKEPVFIYIDKEYIKLYDAKDFFFSKYEESKKNIESILKEKDLEICTISLAGASKVEFSKIIFRGNKYCGKNGIGKLMGEKNLKAIALKKQSKLNFPDEKLLDKVNKSMSEKLNNDNIDSYFEDKNNCYGCYINCESTSVKKLVKKGIEIEKSILTDKVCNEYGMDSIVFSQFLNEDEVINLANKIIENPDKYKNKSILKKETKKADKLDELGFCKFLTDRNIITEEELKSLIDVIKK